MSGIVTVYEDKAFRGRRLPLYLDRYAEGRLHSLKRSSLHDKMSSVRWSEVPEDVAVVFYEHSDGSGREYRISTRSGSDGDTHNNNFKDCASAWRWYRNQPASANIPAAFERVPTEGKVSSFSLGGFAPPGGGHLQGIQRSAEGTFFISYSSDLRAGFVTVENGRIVKDFPLSTTFKHAGGMQICEGILAVGVEHDEKASRVLFIDVTDPSSPDLVGNPIERQGHGKFSTAGAVALVHRGHDHLLIVGGWDSGNLDFYISDGRPLSNAILRPYVWNPACDAATWRAADRSNWIDRNWGDYQGLNLFLQDDGTLFLLAFHRNTGMQDWMDLYRIDLEAQPARRIVKVGKRHMRCEGGSNRHTGRGVSFRYGAGAAYSPDGMHLVALACERDFHSRTALNVFSDSTGASGRTSSGGGGSVGRGTGGAPIRRR